MGCYTNGAKTKCNETTQNAPCSPCDTECPEGIWKTSCIVYTGPDQPDIDVVTNDELNVVIANINDAIAAAAACSFTLTPGSNILIEGASTPVVVACGDDITISTDPCGFTTLNTTVQYNNGPAPCGEFILKQNLVASANNLMVGYTQDLGQGNGVDNVFVGINTSLGRAINGGVQNTGIGNQVFTALTYGQSNSAVGYTSQQRLIGGSYNSSIGFWSLTNTTNGNFNTGIGTGAGYDITTGNYNTCLGANSNTSANAEGAIGVGYQANASSHTAVIGSAGTQGYIHTLYLSGINSQLQYNTTISACGASGTDIPGSNLSLQGGVPTGTGKSGDVIFKSPLRDTVSSTFQQNTVDMVRYRGSGINTNTATTTIIDSYITSSNKTTTFNVRIVAKGPTTDSAFYNYVATFNNNGGTVTQVGTTTNLVIHETVAGWDIDFNINGTSVETRVISTAVAISWIMSAEIFTV